jgi:hypothetical protein
MTQWERQVEEARAALTLLRRSAAERGSVEVFISTAGQSALLPDHAVALLADVLLLQAGGRAALVQQGGPKGERPPCAGCGEPIELEDPDDVESWIHAQDANDRGDHTAWLDE